MRKNGKIYKCAVCDKEIYRTPGQMKKSKLAYCSIECFKKVSSSRMTRINQELNPTRMTEDVRVKIGNSKRKDPKERKSYPKIKGRHEHRIVAEMKIGRPLKKGEVVHHVDGNIQNNKPDNLMVFKSQKEHIEWHNKHDKNWGCKNELQAP